MSWAAHSERYPKASLEVPSPLVQPSTNPHHHITIPSRFPCLHRKITAKAPVSHMDSCHSAFTLKKADLAELPAL